MDIRAILLDFDGTSLESNQLFISKRNMKALDLAMKKGVMVIPSTGRSAAMFPPQIEADPRIRYWITSNGGRVIDIQTGEIIYESTLTPQQSAQVCRLFEGQMIYGEIAAQGRIYMEKEVSRNRANYHIPPHHAWVLNHERHVELENLSRFFLHENAGIEKVNLYGVPEEKQQPLIKALDETGFLLITEGAGKNIQFFPKSQDRCEAIDTLFQKLGLDYSQVMALGDSTLDMPSIKKAKIGVAMSNAPRHVRDAADYIAPPYDQDGAADAIEKFILNQD
ncbi:MAG: HAD family hydrolase [Bacillota bacterium]|nr:HAD family hydrolase [Bacillota bacterium]